MIGPLDISYHATYMFSIIDDVTIEKVQGPFDLGLR